MSSYRPHVLLIVLDAVRADCLSCYGYQRPTTPNIDALARNGIVFENAFSPGPNTVQGHAALFTGLCYHQGKATYADGELAAEPATLAEILRRNGYQTTCISANPWLSETFGFTRGFDETVNRWRRPKLIRLAGRIGKALGIGDKGAAGSCDIALKQLSEAKRPQFVFANLLEAHYPYVPQLPFAIRFAGAKRASLARLRINLCPAEELWNLAAITPEHTFRLLHDLYVASIASMDASIGTLLEKLERRDLLDDTLIIITADHGENLGDHGLVSHSLCLYDTVIHLPMIMHLPGNHCALRSTALIQLNDILPSLCRYLGITLPISLEEQLQQWQDMFRLDSARPGRKAVYAECFSRPCDLARRQQANPLYDFSRLDRNLRAIRTLEWKYITGDDGSAEVYNVREDPGEVDNRIAEVPAVVRQLDDQLREWVEATGTREVSQQPRIAENAYSERERTEVAQRLRDLGYY